LLTASLWATGSAAAQGRSGAKNEIPNTWDDKALANWTTPLTG
jgi:hypothetical protein